MVHDCIEVDYKSNFQNEKNKVPISKAHGNVIAPLTRIISSRNSEENYKLSYYRLLLSSSFSYYVV